MVMLRELMGGGGGGGGTYQFYFLRGGSKGGGGDVENFKRQGPFVAGTDRQGNRKQKRI